MTNLDDPFLHSQIDLKQSSTPIFPGTDVNGNAGRSNPEAVTWDFNSSDEASGEVIEDEIEDVTE